MEVWKPIVGYDGFYEVSSYGRVRNIKRSPWHILKNNNSSNGYLIVGLSRNGHHKTHSVHRIVATAFIQNPDKKSDVNHKDGNKTNNNVENLEWVTKSENERHSFDVLGKKTPSLPNKMRGKYGKLHNRSVPVIQYSLTGEFIREWECMLQIERELGIMHSNISMCCNGKRKRAGQFIFKFKTTNN